MLVQLVPLPVHLVQWVLTLHLEHLRVRTVLLEPMQGQLLQ
jgi:hypothetical protein